MKKFPDHISLVMMHLVYKHGVNSAVNLEYNKDENSAMRATVLPLIFLKYMLYSRIPTSRTPAGPRK